MMSYLRRFVTLSIALAIHLTLFAYSPTEDVFVADVVGVSDGDTIKVLRDGVPIRVRVWGIDCPEKGQAFSASAKRFVVDLSAGKTVSIVPRGIDRYGRTVAEVVLPDGQNLGKLIVKAGLAWWYRRYARNDVELMQLESDARDTKRGLWEQQNPIPPWDWRRR
jgi:micrococcal nuclease